MAIKKKEKLKTKQPAPVGKRTLDEHIENIRKQKYWRLHSRIGNRLNIISKLAGEHNSTKLVLIYIKERFSVQGFTYTYRSKTSWFHPGLGGEERIRCSKVLINSIISMLGRAEIWNYVINQKDLCRINDQNKKASNVERKEYRDRMFKRASYGGNLP